jgi:hypothetical protein
MLIDDRIYTILEAYIEHAQCSSPLTSNSAVHMKVSGKDELTSTIRQDGTPDARPAYR